jgi:hypothetical protein
MMSLLDIAASAASGPLGPLISVAGKVLDKVIPDPEAAAKAKLELAQLQQNGELQKMATEAQLITAEMNNVSDRWKADMQSDSWLSKNIRPLTLIAILFGYFLFASLSAANINVNESYVKLLGEWGQLIMLAYFGGRTAEKIFNKKD